MLIGLCSETKSTLTLIGSLLHRAVNFSMVQ